MDPDEEEREHWWQVMRTFLHYQDFVETELERRQNHLNHLSEAHLNRLPAITFDKIPMLHQAAQVNQQYFEDMVHYHASHSFLDPPAYALDENQAQDPQEVLPCREVGPDVDIAQHHRNQAVLHSLYREWSQEGAAEREGSFGVLVNELVARRPVTPETAFSLRVLVPGCGLGRLALEVASKGYCCEGNEFSAYMAIASNFVLNGLHDKECYEIFPWISNLCNIVKVQDSLSFVKVPDITAVHLLQSYQAQPAGPTDYPRFSMAAGDFNEIYSSEDHREAWDVVLTCFFLDTAPNVLDYLATIDRVLKPGGLWLNLGPLLYHWVADTEGNQDPRYQQSIELTYEELRHCIQGYGFEMLLEQQKDCCYTRCPGSMMHTVYSAMQFSAQKPLNASK